MAIKEIKEMKKKIEKDENVPSCQSTGIQTDLLERQMNYDFPTTRSKMKTLTKLTSKTVNETRNDIVSPSTILAKKQCQLKNNSNTI